MKINAVKFKDKASFDKNKTKANVLEVHEPFGIIVFKDEKEVAVDTLKVSQTNKVDSSISEIPTGLAVAIAKNNEEAAALFTQNKVVVVDFFPMTNTFFVEIPDFVPYSEFYKAMMSSGLFLSVEEDVTTKIEKHADDAYSYTQQWELPNLKAAEAWSLLTNDQVRDVAVLDIACETTHEDLQGSLNLCWNCVTNTADVNPTSPYEKHGTCCTGIIAAQTFNGIGVSSIGANKLRVQFLHIGYNSSSAGSFFTSDTIVTRAINKAMENPDCVAISMSWGGTSNYALFSNALLTAKNIARGGKGIPIFASSGNQYQSSVTSYPAVLPSVNAVGASSQTNVRAGFSNYGTKLFAATPGVSVPTTDRSGAEGYNATSNYTNFSGTSAACPVMAAIAGCILVKNFNLTEAQVLDIIKNSCRKTGGYIYDGSGKSLELGYGVPDLYAAVTLAAATIGGNPNPTPTPTNNVFGLISTNSTIEQGLPINVTYTVLTEKVVAADLTIPITLSFRKLDGTTNIFYSANAKILAGTNTTTAVVMYTIPSNVSGTCQLVLSIDPDNQYLETNETDNIALTNIVVTQAPTPTIGFDAEIKITSYEWLDATRVRIYYTMSNRGMTTITSWKASVGFDGKTPSTWNRADVVAPGKSTSGGTVWYTTSMGTLPNTFKIQITQVNGLIDENSANNVSTIVVTKP